jgi:hypothetical protein
MLGKRVLSPMLCIDNETGELTWVSYSNTILDLDSFLGTYTALSFVRPATRGGPPSDFATRVAILDTGIDMGNAFLQRQVEKGLSFVETGELSSESHWWLPSDPHGTSMASVVCSVDPNCRLFIAKVAVSKRYVIKTADILRVRQESLTSSELNQSSMS